MYNTVYKKYKHTRIIKSNQINISYSKEAIYNIQYVKRLVMKMNLMIMEKDRTGAALSSNHQIIAPSCIVYLIHISFIHFAVDYQKSKQLIKYFFTNRNWCLYLFDRIYIYYILFGNFQCDHFGWILKIFIDNGCLMWKFQHTQFSIDRFSFEIATWSYYILITI